MKATKKVRIVTDDYEGKPKFESYINAAIEEEAQEGWHVRYIKAIPESEFNTNHVFILFTHAPFPEDDDE